MKYFIAIFWISLSFNLSVQDTPVIPQLHEADITGLQITRNDTYDGSSLWGYMNGGADIYLEYGFRGIRVQEMVVDGEKIKAEIYLMNGPESAFGIYTIKIFRCLVSDTILSPDCLGNYQYQAAKGPIYISVMNDSGNETASLACLKAGEKILENIEISSFDIPAFALVNMTQISGSQIKMIKGPLGVQNAIPKWIGLFDGMTKYRIYYLNIKKEGEPASFADIFFPGIVQKELFLKKNFPDYNHRSKKFCIQSDNTTCCILQLDDRTIRLFETKASKGNFEKELKAFEF
nr:hypothetical protein [Bacteroidota bacterium]